MHVIAVFLLCLVISFVHGGEYLLGAGIGDITGPSAEVNFMGYAQSTQIGRGIHFRLRARAFIFGETSSSIRVGYVNVDLCFVDISVKKRVIEILQTKLPGMFTQENLLITATHTHSGPAGYSWYTIYDITCLGSKKDNTLTIINGIVDAVVKAAKNLKPGSLYLNSEELFEPMTNINRSPFAYDNNPAAEKSLYKANVDKIMVNLKMQADDNTPIGAINFFPVHGTSMNNTNILISGDNKGYASLLFEQKINGKESIPGEGPFVAAFTNGNEGDVSPNTLGAFCVGTNLPCDYEHSTCNGISQDCTSRGPGKDIFESTKLIGQQQFNLATALFNTANTKLTGKVKYVHMFVDMEQVVLEPKWTGLSENITTCIAAIGDGFAGGTTDGPGDFNFHQGTNSTTTNRFWNFIAHFLADPPPAQIKCQYPKPILLYTGVVTEPTKWTPNRLPVQILNLGELYILGVPAEFTTMSGRRLKDTVKKTLIANGASSNITVVIAGLSNAYSQYVATFEEFQIQRYEGGSTLFGPHTLHAYQKIFSYLAESMILDKPVPPGPIPQDFTDGVPDLAPEVLFDDGPVGTIQTDVQSVYHPKDTVMPVFYSADPRNNFWQVPTYLTVERQVSDGQWKVIATDGNWETKFYWKRLYNIEFEESLAGCAWEIPEDATPGIYRIGHFGNKKSIFGDITPFSIYSSLFKVVPS